MSTLAQNSALPASRFQAQLRFNSITAIAAATAAAAAGASLGLGLPVWAMFIGWIAFFSTGHTIRTGLASYAGVLIGIALGMGAAIVIATLGPSLGKLALPTVVFVVAMLVVSLRAAPVMNNVLAYFLGLVSFFAAHLEPSLETGVRLGGASAIGSVAAWASLQMQQRLKA
ncbi:DUF1097 domain-containing protein [Pseudomonas sp. Marseille-Q5115]|uniref:DUF1097 domain-containing protein n=1 Tax=Pseudomonas sp. Marseille-Q5115 TaxID=2866593 RepID=UPI001CE45B02|nr:DUF1097 domain-containing protein [Pseudomonas sp. Marseille-Q5115]